MRAACILGALFIGACASSALPPLTAHDPASVDAPETPTAATPTRVAAVAASATPAPSTSAVYRCPMHHEVTSDHPGVCPKCGMTLVLDKDTK